MRTPQAVQHATEEYQSEQDPLGEYLADRCMTGTDAVRVSRNELLADYSSWCQQASEKHFDHIRTIAGVRESTWRVSGVNTGGTVGSPFAVIVEIIGFGSDRALCFSLFVGGPLLYGLYGLLLAFPNRLRNLSIAAVAHFVCFAITLWQRAVFSVL